MCIPYIIANSLTVLTSFFISAILITIIVVATIKTKLQVSMEY